MSDPFLGEIKMFAGNFAPRNYATCDGQLLAISQMTALFALLGTNYGGNGQSTFALPNLQGNAPMFWGSGAGLSQRFIGEQSGTPTVTLLTSEIPPHNHLVNASSTAGGLSNPVNANLGSGARGRAAFFATLGTLAPMQPTGIGGGSQPHNNMQPYLAVTFIIALQGIFPARN